LAIIRFDDTLGCLAVREIADDRFSAPNIAMPYRRIFGGQLLAQCIVVASQTSPGKSVKSLHVIFPREGDLGEPVEYRVDRIQDGRTFAGRIITGWQGEEMIVTASVSLHAAEQGLEHQLEAPPVAGPEESVPADPSMIPWETRVVDGVDLRSPAAGPPRFAFWMRAPEIGPDPVHHQALLAHATDLTLIGTALRPYEGLCETDSPERIQTAVTTHTLWFHRPVRLDQWVLITQESPSAFGARAFAQGHAFGRGGELVASFAQESMVRLVT
jgi:acyl-CoA thioesterase-2